MERYATLDEAWGNWGVGSMEGVSPSLSSLSSVVPRRSNKPSQRAAATTGGDSDLCDLYTRGYARRMDCIMDMYTPGDETAKAVSSCMRKMAVANSDPSPYIIGNNAAEPSSKSPQRSTPQRGGSTADRNGQASGGRRQAQNMIMGDDNATASCTLTSSASYEAYSSGSCFAPFQAWDSDPAMQQHQPQQQQRRLSGHSGLSSLSREDDDNRSDDGRSRAASEASDDVAPASDSYAQRAAPSASSAKESSDGKESKGGSKESNKIGATEGYTSSNQESTNKNGSSNSTSTNTNNSSNNTNTNNNNNAYYTELAVFFLSGILLILVMEQFVQIGLHMRRVGLRIRTGDLATAVARLDALYNTVSVYQAVLVVPCYAHAHRALMPSLAQLFFPARLFASATELAAYLNRDQVHASARLFVMTAATFCEALQQGFMPTSVNLVACLSPDESAHALPAVASSKTLDECTTVTLLPA